MYARFAPMQIATTNKNGFIPASSAIGTVTDTRIMPTGILLAILVRIQLNTAISPTRINALFPAVNGTITDAINAPIPVVSSPIAPAIIKMPARNTMESQSTFLKADFRSRIGSPSILKIARNTIAKNNGVVAVNLSSKRNAADSGARKDKNPGTSQKTNTIRLTTATIFSFFSILPGHLLSNKEKSTVSKCEISGLTTNRNQSNIPIQIINPIGIPISIYPNIFAGCPVIPEYTPINKILEVWQIGVIANARITVKVIAITMYFGHLSPFLNPSMSKIS